MIFQDRVDNDVVVFELSGKIMEFTECLPLRKRVKEYIDVNRINFVFDMAEVPWMNSEGIGLLASALATVGNAGGEIVLANINDKVKKVLVVTGCSSVIKDYDSQEEAIDALVSIPDMR